MTRTLRVGALVGALALALTLAACSNDSDGPSADADHNDADIAFVRGMIPHHQQAIEMSDSLIRGGSDPVILDLAEQIKAAQQPEIDEMRAWLDDRDIDADADAHDDHGTDADPMGMMTDEEMASMHSMNGPALEREFLEKMILHHEGALDMAETYLPDAKEPSVRAIAEAVIATQQVEIDEMRGLLAAR